MTAPAPPARVHLLNSEDERPDGDYVLYWMTATRRVRRNAALQHALHHAAELGKPLLVLEALRVGYRWASDRHHAFILQGMAENAAAFAEAGVAYHPYVEPEPGAGKGLLAALAGRACRVVCDYWPFFFQRPMLEAAADQVPVPLEAIDSVGILPLAAAHRVFTTAASFRRHLQKTLRPHLDAPPLAAPLDGVEGPTAPVPHEVCERWPRASDALLAAAPQALAALPIDHTVGPVASRPGGASHAHERLGPFIETRLGVYHERHRDPLDHANSGLSPWIHFGQLGTWDVLQAVLDAEGWTPDKLGKVTGSRNGWWGLSEGAEGFLDELITWRELGQVWCWHRPDGDRFGVLQDWAQETLSVHAGDERPYTYSLAEFQEARTHDALWNACQRQLLAEGIIHNYLRMYWAKKILHWSATPQQAHATLFELNNRFALDGRDPSSTMNLMWTLGLFDRGWGPERPIFGKVRYMTRSGVERKYKVGRYVMRYAG